MDAIRFMPDLLDRFHENLRLGGQAQVFLFKQIVPRLILLNNLIAAAAVPLIAHNHLAALPQSHLQDMRRRHDLQHPAQNRQIVIPYCPCAVSCNGQLLIDPLRSPPDVRKPVSLPDSLNRPVNIPILVHRHM